MKSKVLLFGAGQVGRQALEVLGASKVDGFIDNNIDLEGKMIEGVPVKRIECFWETIEHYDVVVSVSARFRNEIKRQLLDLGVKKFYDVEMYLQWQQFSENEIEQYREKYKGKKCFVLGTGPSLLHSDLDRMAQKGILCFAANKIFKAFDETEWRPDFYCATDKRILNHYQDRIRELELPNMFISYRMDKSLEDTMKYLRTKPNVQLFSLVDSMDDDAIEFSDNPAEYIIEGRTVIYAMLQLAVYMGFSDIYIAGVDFNYNDKTGYDQFGNDHFCKNYIEKGEEVMISPQEYCLNAFKRAKQYAEEKGIHIYNATRGGKLEVFQRVDIDEILERE